MRAAKRTDPLSTTLASGALARLLIHFATHPGTVRHMRALGRVTGLPPRSLQTELMRLVRLGLVRRARLGRQVRYMVNEESPRWRVLRELVRELADPADVLREALAGVPGIEGAFVFGSYARGTAVRETSDIDLFILRGDLDEDELARRTLDAGVLLKLEVNPVVMRPEDVWEHVVRGGGFIRSILDGPKLWVAGDKRTLRAATAERS